MAHLDHKEAFEELRSRTLDGIKKHFPVEGRTQLVDLEDLEVQDEAIHADDIRGQHAAKVEGATWAAPIFGTLVLKDKNSGKVIERKKLRLAELPMVTRRFSFIVDGQEWQVDNQWQLRPGVYTRWRQSGELETQFNVPNKQSFRITFDPEKKLFLMDRGGSKAIPVYPLLKTLGVPDAALEKQWGKDIFEANKDARGISGALAKFFKADRKRQPTSNEEAAKYLIDTMHASQLRPDVTEITLGSPFSNVSGDALARATTKMVNVYTKKEQPDDRDSLVFKDLRSAGDFAYDKLTNYATIRTLQNKIQRKLNNPTSTLRDIVRFDTFNEPIKQTFTNKGGLARTASQINPVEMISSSMRTTLMGPGGISSADKVKEEAKLVNNSHFGFLDPIHTPESENTGVTLHLPIGVKKIGNNPTIQLYNIQTGMVQHVPPKEFIKANVVLPDQVEWKNGKPIPRSETVKVSRIGNEIGEAKFSDAKYVMRHPWQLFDVTSNLIPFMGNTSGNRASYATHHIDQAISLEGREPPLVQVSTGSPTKGMRSFEELLGRHTGHLSPVTGKVVEIKKDAIIVADDAGKKHEVQIYKNFPLNDTKAVLDSTPTVHVGQTVRAGDSIADTNFTRGGKLALGTNLHVAYIPFKGYNFEDGVVISESAAKKLSSVHLHKPSTVIDEKTITTKSRFEAKHSEAFTKTQLRNIDDHGFVRPGTIVRPGDPLVLAMRPFELKDRLGREQIRKAALGAHTDASLKWDSDHTGEVVAVHKNKDGQVTVHVRTLEKMQVGDKLSGRYGNKGIVTLILPDNQMPKTQAGQHIEVALNPSGIPGRVNVGQVLETAAAKIAKKTGKPYIVENFEKTEDMLRKVQDDLKRHGLSDTEELIDPATGINLGHVLTGPQHMLKLTHQVDKKISARAGMDLPGLAAEGYDRNLMPVGGGKTGAQSMGNLGMYVMLSHGAKSNIREMQTWKSEGPDPAPEGKRWPSQHEQVWNAIQTGDTLPVPKPTFAFQKFVDMLRVAGVNVEKKGHNLQIAPLTDAQVLKMSNGEIKHPGRLVEAKIDKATGEPKPIPGGLFDPTVTGGHGGRKWGHFTLAEPMPNPVFEGAIQKVLGMPEKDYTALVNGEKALNPSSHALVPLGTRGSIAGGPAIVRMLEGIDVKKELASAKKELDKFALTSDVAHKSGSSKIDPLVKRVKYLNALDQLGMTAKEAYTLQHVPVLPPAMRPGTLSPDGNMQWADLNGLYKEVGELNEKMKNPAYKMYFGDEDKKEHRAGLYDGLKAIVGVGTNYTDRADKNKGVLLQISGRAPKMGYFQKTLLSRRQDLSMRSTIIPEPAMGLDQAGLPTDRALTLFRPFVVKKLVDLGAAKHPLEAQKLLASKEAVRDKQVLSALDQAMAERPILLKRDPALHKHSVMAFNAFRVPGRAIQIHPLVTGGFNADFDGDAMSVYVPIHPEAVQEAKSMIPSNNLFNEATGRVMHVPTLESALGLFKLTRINGDAGKSFTHPADALKAVESGKVGVDQLVDVKGIGKTTAGRLLVASVLPEQLQKKVITDHGMVLDKKGLGELYTSLAKDHRGDFGDAANRLKDLGYGAAFGAVKIPHPNHVGTAAIAIAENPKQGVRFLPIGTHTLSLKDFEPDRQTRDAVVHQTQAKVEAIRRSSSLTPEAKDQRIVEEWLAATKTMMSDHLKKAAAKPDNLYDMLRAGVKPGIEQYQQLKLGPMILQDATGRFIPTPVAKSYAEGLDVAGYWTQMHGARKGSVQKVQEVSDPGAFSKLLINTTLGLQVNGHDCKTARGIALPVDSKEIYDRELATDVTVRGRTFPRGTVLTPDVVGQIRAGDPAARLSVRSPLKCEHGRGLCQKCAGIAPNGRYYDVGTNLGVISSQSLGERAVQLTLKAFHTGGVAGADGNVLQGFGRIEQLTTLPKKFANEASLAMKSGVVEKLEKDKLGTTVVISGQKHFVPLDRGGRYLTEPITNLQKLTGESWPGLKVGQRVEAGETISDPTRTVINPHELYRATKKIDKVQNHLVNELYKIYSQEGVRRQHVETVVKGMSNLSRVIDPGDGQHILKGEYKPTSVIHALNQQLVNKGQRPVMVAPILQGINVLPLNVQEDWLAKLNFQRLRDTISESAATAALSDLHGTHPIPGMAYGAEFGMTGKHKLRAPHLHDVPEHSY